MRGATPVNLVIGLLLLAAPARGQEPEPEHESAPRTFVVGTKVTPPFVMKDEKGRWTGIAVELWREIQRARGWKSEWRESDLGGLTAGVAGGEFDIVVGALTMTPEREEKIDFTFPWFDTGLGIATRTEVQTGWMAVAKRFFTFAFLQVFVVLVLLLLGAGLLVWIFERKKNEEQFGGRIHTGLGSAFWWSAVTMTTVGYGDKSPRSVGGRVVALVWMFTSIVVISSFTASMASTMTVVDSTHGVRGPDDLHRARLGTVRNSTSEEYVAGRGLRYQTFGTVSEALAALEAEEIEAVVYDRPILKYLVATEVDDEDIEVLESTFEHQRYAFALPSGSMDREEINLEILRILERPWWPILLNRYLEGRSAGSSADRAGSGASGN